MLMLFVSFKGSLGWTQAPAMRPEMGIEMGQSKTGKPRWSDVRLPPISRLSTHKSPLIERF